MKKRLSQRKRGKKFGLIELFLNMKIIKKPWGQEIIYAHDNGYYMGKKLFIRAGEKLSLQDHLSKHETFFLEAGCAEVTVDEEIVQVCDTDSLEKRVFIIKPRVKHRIVAITDCSFLESSTDHPDDVRRFEDEYGREQK